MIYGYIRVSSDKQTVENQRLRVLHFLFNALLFSLFLSDKGHLY